MPKPTLDNEKIDKLYAAVDIDDFEHRAFLRAQERAERHGAVAGEEDASRIRTWATVAGMTALFAAGIVHYNHIHAGQPIHGPAVPEQVGPSNP